VEFVGHSSVRKLLSFTLGRFLYEARPANRAPRDAWLVANVVLCVATDLVLFATGGIRPLIYLVLSALLAFGPHVIGARRVAEHLTLRRGQPTNSYYGPLNRITFDVGHHVEHHDFPAVAWSRLRRLRATAREHYDGLATVPSWSLLIAAYFFDRRYGVAQYTGVAAEYLEDGPVDARAVGMTTTVCGETPDVDGIHRIDTTIADSGVVQRLHSIDLRLRRRSRSTEDNHESKVDDRHGGRVRNDDVRRGRRRTGAVRESDERRGARERSGA
jgi:hypothetical protein